MEVVAAAASILESVTLGGLAVWLFSRPARTIVDLRKITVGLNDVLGWAAGNVLADPSSRVTADSTVAARTPKLGSG